MTDVWSGEDLAQVVRMLNNLGLTVISINQEAGEMTVRLP